MKPGIVYLIGAGPGDPGLITVKGRDCLHRADAVVYDYLANPLLLREAPRAEAIFVGKSRGNHHRPQEEINRLLVELASQGKVVARLKGGDPFIFGRGGEEAQALHQAGIPFEVVPGVTAGFAAAAYAGIPLTHRDYTTSLALLTGHEDPDKGFSRLDWAKLATGVGTLVFYMGMANLEIIAGQLQAHGRPATTPVAVIRWGTTAEQETLIATLGDVVARVRETGIKPPAIIVVGEVVKLRQQLRWFDRKPLFGRGVLVTRAGDQAGEFGDMLGALGARVYECPTIRLDPPAEHGDLDAALSQLAGFDWLVLSSVNAVHFFFARLAGLGRDARALGYCRVCAVGPKTAAAIRGYGIVPDLVPEDYKAEGVVAAMAGLSVAPRRVLFPRADKAREVIPQGLSALGAEVVAPVAYCNVLPPDLPAEALAALEAGKVACVTFTASSTVENLAALLGPERFPRLLQNVVVAAIGPITSATCRKLGLEVAIEPEEYTLTALADAIVAWFAAAPQEPSCP
ncbi:MAG: uroporphyrinogen-III C-methyltransferase [Desulfuromonadales bacterium GWD2_61_12]|nr:MAG: uroporphyrinogen-III C-methyltransferase [Desulfuromonadales bacterium GWC2_61_20]OGR35357.1 MAG: uroporphyrinogen-III C-methyltransferase [Desulfuromonadales bacterium GWD2_61_12]HAD04203.1 uroporphyrinogen-III C-methyltransferase [Desulfuromonas sp.]HBT81969.1 uroporphyrinogen-III C-methyltransferase [Desulfuromonas sp.]